MQHIKNYDNPNLTDEMIWVLLFLLSDSDVQGALGLGD